MFVCFFCEEEIWFLILSALFQTCLRESDNSNEEDSLSTHSEDRLSEGSWDRVERRDTEVSLLLWRCNIYSLSQLPPTHLIESVFIISQCLCVCVGHEVGARPHGLPLFQL